MIFCESIISQNFSFDTKNLTVGQSHATWSIIFSSDGKLLKESNSKATLDSIRKFLEQNPTIKVEIGSHTNKDHDLETDLIYSKKCATSIKDYLFRHGIDSTRLSIKGYGHMKPYLTGEQEIKRKEQCYPLQFPSNERTVITILKI